MTPEVVVYRYLEVLQREPVDVAALTRIICADADLMGVWLNVLSLPADPDLLRQKLSELPSDVLRTVARAQAQGMVFDFAAVHLSIERWESALRGAFLAEALAREVLSRQPQPAKADRTASPTPTRVRSLILLATSGVSLSHDSRLQELIEFRGTDESALADAESVHQILAVIDLCDEPEESARLADHLLKVTPERLGELGHAAAEACQRMLKVIGIDDEPDTAWSERISQDERIATLSMLFESIPHGSGDASLLTRHELASRVLFRTRPSLLLRREDGAFHLEPAGDVRVLADSERSDIARACREGISTTVSDHDGASIADRLVLRRLQANEAMVFPLTTPAANQPCAGALVFPFDEDPEPDYLMRAYAQLLSRVVNGKSAASALPDATAQVEAFRQRAAQRLRELVHEANNPLSIVNNYLHILELRLSDDSSIREQLGTMSRELKRAAAIVQQMKDLPPAEEQPQAMAQPATSPCDIAVLVRRIVELHRGYADAASVEIDLLPVPATVQLVTDENLLSQVLVNLLRNAIEACRSGDLVTVGLQEEVYRDGVRGVEIDVHDSGPGIEPEVLSRLFEPKTSTKGPEHSGLGLSIVHRLVGTLGGSIDVRTSATSGTSFRIFLPAAITASS